MFTIFGDFYFWPISKQGVKIFEPTPWIFHWNILKNNILHFRGWLQSISSGSRVCRLFSWFVCFGQFPITEWKYLSRRNGSFTWTYQRTTLFSFVGVCKVFPQAALCVNYFSDFCFWSKFQAQSENLRADALNPSLQLIKEQHSSILWVDSKYFFGQRRNWIFGGNCLLANFLKQSESLQADALEL